MSVRGSGGSNDSQSPENVLERPSKISFVNVIASFDFLSQGEEEDPFGSRESPEKEEGLSSPKSHPGEAGTLGQERGNDLVGS